MAERSENSPDLSRKAVLEAETDKHMNLVENRLASFERWPFIGGDCRCTPERMSEAGFYHCPTEEDPDLARCYVCFMELHCWEPGDDPFKEHLCSPDCAFVRMSKKAEDLTVRDFLELEKARAKNRAHKLAEMHMATLDDTMSKVNHETDKVRTKK
uniref:Baculoviral IAP repeat-containing protein 5 n=1 Tax=Rhipicephalus appendiculatus TaxID=34631 RepID=A0A131YLX1_RHIAP